MNAHFPIGARLLEHSLWAALLLASALAAVAQPVPVVYLYGSGTDPQDFFGQAVAVLDGGRTLLVGAERDRFQNPNNPGRVYVFSQAAPGAAWLETGFWNPPGVFPWSDAGNGSFGEALAVATGDSLVAVGAPGARRYRGMDPYVVTGAMNIYRRAGEVWTPAAFLQDPEGPDFAKSGSAVTVAGRLAVMNLGFNRARLYRNRGADGPGGAAAGWADELTVTVPGNGPSLYEPGALAVMDDPIEGERLVAGARFAPGAGQVTVWRNDGGDGTPGGTSPGWVVEAVLQRAVPGGAFGTSVSLSPDGQLLAVGADEFSTSPYTGRAYVFRREGAGAASVWVEEAMLLPSRPPPLIGYGRSVTLSTDPATDKPTLLVGAGRQLYVYRREIHTGTPSWTEAAFAADTFYTTTPRLSGYTAAAGYPVAGERGTNAGRALVFDLRAALAIADAPSPDAPSLAVTVTPNPVGAAATVQVSLPAASALRVTVIDALGREMARLHEGPLGAGAHRLSVPASSWPPGVYVVRAVAASGVAASRFVVAR